VCVREREREKETFEGLEIRSGSHSLCILVCSLQMLSALIFDPHSFLSPQRRPNHISPSSCAWNTAKYSSCA